MKALWNSLPQDIVKAEALNRCEEGSDKFQENQQFVAIKPLNTAVWMGLLRQQVPKTLSAGIIGITLGQ